MPIFRVSFHVFANPAQPLPTANHAKVRSIVGWRALLIALLCAVSANVFAQAKAGWTPVVAMDGGTSTLKYTADATLLGKPGKFTVNFQCNPFSDKNSTGFLGFDVTVANAPALKPFNFDDFAGPDATAAKKQLVQVSVSRGGKVILSAKTSQSGSHQDNDSFAFEVGDSVKLPKSFSKTLLRTLAEGADSLKITVTDSRKASLKLEFAVPVEGKQAEFAKLLANLK